MSKKSSRFLGITIIVILLLIGIIILLKLTACYDCCNSNPFSTCAPTVNELEELESIDHSDSRTETYISSEFRFEFEYLSEYEIQEIVGSEVDMDYELLIWIIRPDYGNASILVTETNYQERNYDSKDILTVNEIEWIEYLYGLDNKPFSEYVYTDEYSYTFYFPGSKLQQDPQLVVDGVTDAMQIMQSIKFID